MMTYIKVGRLCGLLIEWDRNFTLRPMLKCEKYKDELVIDMPYCRIIYTPCDYGPQRRVQINEKEGRRLSCPVKRTSENRS